MKLNIVQSIFFEKKIKIVYLVGFNKKLINYLFNINNLII